MDNSCRLIVFKGNRRIVKVLPRERAREVQEKVKELREQGLKAHVAMRTERRAFPPADEIREMREAGMMWCPYCGAWRWFVIPRYTPSAADDVGSPEWFDNSLHRQEIRACKWCGISAVDWYVRRANQTWSETDRRRTRKKTLRTRRRG